MLARGLVVVLAWASSFGLRVPLRRFRRERPASRSSSACREVPERPRVAVLGGGFAGLTAARTLERQWGVDVVVVDQRRYFEYTPGILRAWVDVREHARLVNPLARLLRGRSSTLVRVEPGALARLRETVDGPKPLALDVGTDVSVECDYVVIATGGDLSPLSDDRLTADGTIEARASRRDPGPATVAGVLCLRLATS